VEVRLEGGPLDDGLLVARARAGDQNAFAELVGRYQEVAFRTAYVMLADPDGAADAAQESFIKAFQALPGFDPKRPFKPWLLRIVVNEALNLEKATPRRRELALRLGEAAARGDAAPSPEAALLGWERLRVLADALLELLAGDRTAVVALRYFQNLGEAELADALGCPRGTVKSWLHRAVARLWEIVITRHPDLKSACGWEE
jgi:RNA polymerase sigma factor (sigma-70 family)